MQQSHSFENEEEVISSLDDVKKVVDDQYSFHKFIYERVIRCDDQRELALIITLLLFPQELLHLIISRDRALNISLSLENKGGFLNFILDDLRYYGKLKELLKENKLDAAYIVVDCYLKKKDCLEVDQKLKEFVENLLKDKGIDFTVNHAGYTDIETENSERIKNGLLASGASKDCSDYMKEVNILKMEPIKVKTRNSHKFDTKFSIGWQGLHDVLQQYEAISAKLDNLLVADVSTPYGYKVSLLSSPDKGEVCKCVEFLNRQKSRLEDEINNIGSVKTGKKPRSVEEQLISLFVAYKKLAKLNKQADQYTANQHKAAMQRLAEGFSDHIFKDSKNESSFFCSKRKERVAAQTDADIAKKINQIAQVTVGKLTSDDKVVLQELFSEDNSKSIITYDNLYRLIYNLGGSIIKSKRTRCRITLGNIFATILMEFDPEDVLKINPTIDVRCKSSSRTTHFPKGDAPQFIRDQFVTTLTRANCTYALLFPEECAASEGESYSSSCSPSGKGMA